VGGRPAVSGDGGVVGVAAAGVAGVGVAGVADRAGVVEQLRARLAAVPSGRGTRPTPGTRPVRGPDRRSGDDVSGDSEPDDDQRPGPWDEDGPVVGRDGDGRAPGRDGDGRADGLRPRGVAERRGLAAATVRAASAVPVDPSALIAVADPLEVLLPDGGLRRGSVVSVLSGPADPPTGRRDALSPRLTAGLGAGPVGLGAGTTSLVLALLSRASAGGCWAAVVGVPALGALAASEAGVDLARLALVPDPGPDLTGITAALVDGMDLVAVAGPERLSAPERSRLTARARQRGAVLLPLGVWPGADVVLRCAGSRWAGIGSGAAGSGAARSGAVGAGGRLRQREVLVSASGRRTAVPVSTRLLLPSVAGPVGRVAPTGSVDDAGVRVDEVGEAGAERREMAG